MTKTRSYDPTASLEILDRFLRHLGWGRALDKSPRPLVRGRVSATTPKWKARFARDPEIPTFAILAPLEGPLTPLRHLYTQFEDLGGEVRHLLSWWRENPPRPEYLLLTDGEQTLLVDAETEECLASCEVHTDLSERVLPHLDFRDVARGSLREFPRRTPDDYGKEMAGWISHWTATLGSSLKMERPSAQSLVESLFLARLAERLGFAPGKPRIEDWAWIGEGAGGDAGSKAKGRRRQVAASSPALKPLRRLWQALDAAGYLRTFRLTERQLLALVERLHPADLPDRWLAGVSRQSWKRFRAEVFAAAFADEELRHKSWTSMVTGELPAAPVDPQNSEDSSVWLHTIWELDLDALGYQPVLRALDVAVDSLREYNLTQRAVALRGDRAHLQLSLFEPPPEGLTATLRLTDPVAHALANVVRVRTQSGERARMMRFVLAARALELHEAAAPLLQPIPDLRSAVPEP